MNNKYFKDFVLLAVVIVITGVLARFLSGGETLEEYAQKNSDATKNISTVAETESIIASTATEETKNAEISPVSEVTNSDKGSPSEKEITSAAASKEIASAEGTTVPKDADNAAMSFSSMEVKSTEASSVAEEPGGRIIYSEGFYYEPISNEIFGRISGISYPTDCSVPLDDLRYVVLQYVDFSGNDQTGEMICNKAIAKDIVEIFYELYISGYQIESIKLIDEFDGDDTSSMLANNTSCFNYRVVEGTTHLSKHALGMAIDLNPFYNPYITYNSDGTINISPKGSEAYADRAGNFPYKIDENDLAFKLFKQHDFTWGGNWNSVKDYQHFERSK